MRSNFPSTLYVLQMFNADSGEYEFEVHKDPADCVGKMQGREAAVYTFTKQVRIVNKTEVV